MDAVTLSRLAEALSHLARGPAHLHADLLRHGAAAALLALVDPQLSRRQVRAARDSCAARRESASAGCRGPSGCGGLGRRACAGSGRAG